MVGNHASELYAKIQNFLELLIHEGEVKIDLEDEIINESLVTHNGEIYNPKIKEQVEGFVMIEGLAALYIFMLAGFTGYEIISKVPVILHTPLMSGSNFVHGIVLVGAMIALGIAENTTQQIIGFLAVLLGAGNAVSGTLLRNNVRNV